MAKKNPKRPEMAPEPTPKEPRQLDRRAGPQDDDSVRRKSSGHKKVTADKWNQ